PEQEHPIAAQNPGRERELHIALAQWRGREHCVHEAAKDPGRLGFAGKVDAKRKHLVAQNPAEGAVGQNDPEPVASGRALDRAQDLAALGHVHHPVSEAGAGMHLGLLGEHAHHCVLGPRGARCEHGCQKERREGQFHGAVTHILTIVTSGPVGLISMPPPCVTCPSGCVTSALASALVHWVCSVAERYTMAQSGGSGTMGGEVGGGIVSACRLAASWQLAS